MSFGCHRSTDCRCFQAKYLAQIIVMGAQVVGRAFARAVRQEYVGMIADVANYITSHHSHPDKGFPNSPMKWRLYYFFVSLTASQAAAQARGQSSQQSAAASSITGMSLQEAQQILNMSTLSPEEIQKVRKTLEPMARALWPCCFRSFFTCAETYFPFWDNKSMECPSTLLANMFTVFENLICLVAKYSGLKDLFVFVSFRTTITFSKSMTSRWAVHFTFNQKWVTATAKIFSF